MKANANVQGVKRWYAVVRDRRIGDDLVLRRGEVPLSKAEFAAELGDQCPLIATPSEYRRRMNDAVFGFPSEDAYQTMLTLMLELRRPHLSKALDPSGVTRLLSGALPEVDHDLIVGSVMDSNSSKRCDARSSGSAVPTVGSLGSLPIAHSA